jgi:dipeptidase E
MSKKLLLVSNSTNAGEEYLGWPRHYIQDFAAKHKIRKVLFIPYAGVNLTPEGVDESFGLYEQRVAAVFNILGIGVYSIHRQKDPADAVTKAEAITVGGGNTFHLVKLMQEHGLMDPMKKAVERGVPFMGWSAGANVACPTLCTTNDMPISRPPSFDCLGLIPFQINPHYLDSGPAGHGGETREQRIMEFLAVNRDRTVVGLREASLLEMENGVLSLKGSRTMRVFQFRKEPVEYMAGDDISFLLKQVTSSAV